MVVDVSKNKRRDTNSVIIILRIVHTRLRLCGGTLNYHVIRFFPSCFSSFLRLSRCRFRWVSEKKKIV